MKGMEKQGRPLGEIPAGLAGEIYMPELFSGQGGFLLRELEKTCPGWSSATSRASTPERGRCLGKGV